MRCAKGKLVARIALLLFTVSAMAVITYFDPVPLKGEMEIECIGYAQFSFFGKAVDDKQFGNRILEFDYACGFSMDGIKPGDHVRLEYELWPADENAADIYNFHFDLDDTDSYVIVAVRRIGSIGRC